MSGRIDLRPALSAIWHARMRVLGAAALAGVLTLGAAFLMPRWYRATAVILPPEESDLLSNMSLAQRALTRFPAFGILNDYFTPADIFKAVLGSRTVQEELIRRFDLQTVYKQKSLEKTVKALRENSRVKLNPDGTIQVSVEDKDPKRAAEMANAYLEELDRFNVEKRNSQARRTREFLQRRVEETDSLLRASEVALRTYQERTRTVVPTAMQSADVSSAADLMARKLMLEVRLGVLRGYLRGDHEQIRQLEGELASLGSRIAAVPALQTDLTRLVRDQKVYEQLFLLLTAELEQSRIRETMDTPTVQLLDPATVPERHSRPKRLILAIAAALLAGVAMALWVGAQARDPLDESA